MDADIPYLLLTPGPLTTSRTVRETMLRDYCTWDDDYNTIVSDIRDRLVRLATTSENYTAVLMQGSGTFSVEATLGSVIPPDGKLLVVNNGAYGARIVQIAERLGIACREIAQPEVERADLERVEAALRSDTAITHVALVHCETTTGMLNPAGDVGRLAREYEKIFILDAMSSFGGIPLSNDAAADGSGGIESLGAHFLVSSANKCIQGVPGFGFVIAHRATLAQTAGRARSLSLDLFDQWQEMENKAGKWRYTSPTHTVRAFAQALLELEAEGGVAARYARYSENHRRLCQGMERLGFKLLLPPAYRAPIITSFIYPDDLAFAFMPFYEALKLRRFVIYPGKVSTAETFRIGNIGHVFPDDMRLLVEMIAEALEELGVRLVGART
ncbi:MAG: 2-aminoethylphosphonate--pyruvate transaminase [Planctomycetales bacterium]|nr:2-aminoethylphosphonate--pyruvate transaminase [Planctomycetales bacterium]